MDGQGLRHLQALRSFIGNLVDQAERAGGCDCHKPPSLLLVGPPGAGKTYLVKQMSNVCEMPLYGVHTNQVRGAAAVRKLFDQARDNYPSLVFMDDIDAIFVNHDRDPSCNSAIQSLRDELFTQLGPRKLKIKDPKSSINPTDSLVSAGRGVNGVSGSRASSRASSSRPRPSAPPDDDEDVFGDDVDSPYPDNNGIIVVAATSSPWMLYKDHELLSRFRGVYLVGLPDKQTRYNLLCSLFQDVHHNLSDKEIMVVAEKTEGFTPADLMVVVKTLTYRQFSFLLSMSAARSGSVASSSDVGSTGSQTPLSSEMSETASESDLDGLPESEGHLKRGSSGGGGTAAIAAAAVAAAAVMRDVAKSSANKTTTESNAASGAVPKKDLKHVNSDHRSHSKSPTGQSSPSPVVNTAAAVSAVAAAVTTLSTLSDEWDTGTDHEEEGEEERPYSSPESQRAKHTDAAPTRVLDNALVTTADVEEERPRDELCVPSPDSAIGLSKSNEEMEEPHNTSHNTSQAEGSETLPRAPSESSSSGVTSSGCDSSDSGDMSAIVGDAAKESGTHSDSEAERENAGWEDRTTVEEEVEVVKKVEAVEVDNVEEAEEDVCDGGECGGDDAEEKERVGSPLDFELHYSEPAEPLRDDNCAIDSDSDNDISESGRTRGRRVAFSGMSPMEPLSVDVGDGCSGAMDTIPPNITLAPSSLPEPLLPSDRRQDGAPNPILLSLLARPSPAREHDRDRDRDRDRDHEPTTLSSFLHPDPDLDVTKTSTPIEPLDALTPTPSLTRTPTPTPSEASSNNGTVASSGSGRRVSAGSTSSEVNKKDDSDDSFDHSDGHTVPSSDMSTATCNETGETMECRTDSDERLQELEDVPDHSDSARASEYGEAEAKAGGKGGLSSLLNLDDLGEISIQLITLADVLGVVNKGYRSISDEEIKRYTDFMVWFSNVAKSACPHSKDGSHRPNAPHLDEISLDSTVFDVPSIVKKRKGPLRKLGRFLLKALMFILD
ncbi:dentin sialophosphoprotein-like isoform X2 [Scylla paramamosain]|uniref:dentin sialophosphoprotein-like isoform X2 n=1 Tax=Scylla paramamosain TaxID=85552 RepID=UPI003082A572